MLTELIKQNILEKQICYKQKFQEIVAEST